MGNIRKNDWEKKIEKNKLSNKQINLDSMYDHAHSEMSLQQSKRDQIITIYLAMCSLLIPITLDKESELISHKGIVFMVLAVIGILFSIIAIRYREYKEIYWICCQTITVLKTVDVENIDKSAIQRAFYFCIEKRGKKFLKVDENKRTIRNFLYVRKSIFSAETMYFFIISLMTAIVSGVGFILKFNLLTGKKMFFGIGAGVIVFLLLNISYFRTCVKIYEVLEYTGKKNEKEERDKIFNKIFSKAWFLHIYYDEQ